MLKDTLWALFHVSVIVGVTYLAWKHKELMNFLKGEWEKKELRKMNGNEEDKRDYDEYLEDISMQFNEEYEKEERKKCE